MFELHLKLRINLGENIAAARKARHFRVYNLEFAVCINIISEDL